MGSEQFRLVRTSAASAPEVYDVYEGAEKVAVIKLIVGRILVMNNQGKYIYSTVEIPHDERFPDKYERNKWLQIMCKHIRDYLSMIREPLLFTLEE